MSTMTQTRMVVPHGIAPLSTKAGVIALVVSAHLLVMVLWSTQPHGSVVAPQELTVSFVMAEHMSQPEQQPLRKAPHLPPAVEVPVQDAPVEAAAAVVEPSETPAAPAIADTEPDYKASYLNNTPPSYPLLARRMGLQGKVVLNVEVLAAGVCGKVNIQKSSGHAMLDNAALQAVRTWRFMPARQAGQAVDKWFMIPIQFSLKDQAA